MEDQPADDWKGQHLLSKKRAHGCATIKAIRPSGPSKAFSRAADTDFREKAGKPVRPERP